MSIICPPNHSDKWKIVLQEIKKWNIRNQGLVCNTEHIYIIPFHNCQEWTIFLEEWRSFDNYWILQSISSSLSDNCWMETDWEMSPPNTHWQRRGRWRSAGDCYLGEDYRIVFVLPKLPKLPVYLLIEGQCVMAAVTTKSGGQIRQNQGTQLLQLY